MEQIILILIILSLSITCFFLIRQLRQKNRRLVLLERETTLHTLLSGILQETKNPFRLVAHSLSSLGDYVAYLQELVLQLHTRSTLNPEELKRLESFKGEERVEKVMANLDQLIDQMEQAMQ
ncbi:MAG: hypothetical protein Q7S00_07695, partial [bacterium]|nr:hypothetical protein [bacterium]